MSLDAQFANNPNTAHLVGVRFDDEPEPEPGAPVIDRKRCWCGRHSLTSSKMAEHNCHADIQCTVCKQVYPWTAFVPRSLRCEECRKAAHRRVQMESNERNKRRYWRRRVAQ